ncbi:MAG: hypothetical protein IIV43_01910 [Oscillospiraceae bacterium]|nr:hypothetical protein [Oscillospiraceae bacterium]
MLLAEGKSCRVVALDGDSVVDYDINEALSMHKGLEQYGLQVMENMTGI